jgi:acyl carrier protein
MMDEAAILAKLTYILREHVQYSGEIDGSMNLREDLNLDSLQQLTFIVETENAFELCLSPQAEEELASIDDVVRYIRTHQPRAEPAHAPQVGTQP